MGFQCTPLSLAEGAFTCLTQWHTRPIRKERGQSISDVKLGELWRDAAAAAECVSVCFVLGSRVQRVQILFEYSKWVNNFKGYISKWSYK